MEGVIGVVTTVAYDFAPRNWAYCNGQVLPIAQNQALFSILGTTYGGNGVTTFALPNLQSRSVVSQGSSGGLNYQLGETEGTETATMTTATMPAHVHNGVVQLSLSASNQAGDQSSAENNYMGGNTANAFNTAANTTFGAPTYQATIGIAGGGVPFNTLMPYITLNYVICLYGLFPSRN
jgi:microcystin-dependent protein